MARSGTPPAESPPPSAAECATLQKRIGDYVQSHRSCKTADDCAQSGGYCDCGFYISAGAEAGLDRLNQSFTDNQCFRVSPPRPCPTCNPLPPPKCAQGRCTTLEWKSR